MSESKKISSTVKLTECAILLALATVLSFVKLIDLPYGGSVSAFSMLPVIIAAYRHGTVWGVLTAFVYSIIQLIFGLSNVSYATTAIAAVSIILLDYIIAFTVLGLGGSFKKVVKDQTTAIVIGTILVCVLRYICHTYVGCTVWAGLSIPTTDALFYSLAYNATYMLPETIITVIGAVLISDSVNLKSPQLKIVQREKKGNSLLNIIANLLAAIAVVVDVILVSGYLQNSETGDFDITGITKISSADYLTLLIVNSLVGIGLFIAFKISARKSK